MRRLTFVAATAIIVALGAGTACSADDSPLTGVFVDGPVAGLHYETPTQSGLTTAKGEFKYKSGETVTFTVGGVVLGAANGRKQLSPFDLFGMTPVTEWSALQLLLTDQIVTDFDRVANIALFLQALDVDRNPENGIDLGDWGTRLAGANLGFGEDLDDWVYGSFSRFAAGQAGVNRNIDVASVLPHLYASLGLTVSGYLQTGVETDGDNDGTADARATFTYDAVGRQIRTQRDNNANGIIDQDNSITYDASGNSTNYTYRSDADENGSFEATLTYDYTRDAAGDITKAVATDTHVGVIGLKRMTTTTYDAAGNTLTVLDENDNGGNGSVESTTRTTNTYDIGGHQLTSRTETDSDNNGTPNAVSTNTQSWNVAGYLVESVDSSDDNADGTFEQQTKTTYTVDDAGLVVARDTENRVSGALTERQHDAFTYDSEGRRLTSHYEEDSDADGTIDQTRDETSTYAPRGGISTFATAIDTDADGTVNATSLTTKTFDANGRVTSQLNETDNNVDGHVDSANRYVWAYDAFGNLTSFTSSQDNNADGTDEYTSKTTQTYTEAADALYRLVYYYVVD